MEEKKSYYAIIPASVRYDKDLTANAKLLYGEITALCNERGYCWCNNSYFANLYEVSNVSISKWIASLVQKGYIASYITYKEGTKEIDKRYLTILNDPIKEKFNTPIKENFKENITKENNTLNNTFKKKYKRKDEDYASEFEQLWSNYPNKQGKERAKASYIKARNSGVSYETILDGLNRYVEHCKIKGKDKQYIKHGSTWFAQSCWQDDYDMTPPKQQDEVTRGENGVNYIPYEQLSDKEKEDFDFWG